MIVAIASGKGGTGKTTLAVNLAVHAAKQTRVRLFDCDVEEPNAQLFVQGDRTEEEIVCVKVPEVDQALCNGCGQCGELCRFNAITPCPSQTFVFPELCHSCGGCALVCPQKAISETDKRIGVIETFSRGPLLLTHGRLDVGQAMAPPLIRALKRKINPSDTTILDAPPGTSCPVTATVREADFTVLVTEPTPFGLNDLVLAVDMARELELDFGVVINRADGGDGRVKEYCARENITVLAEIPDSREIAESYSRGEIFTQTLPRYAGIFGDLWERVAARARKGRAQ